MMLRITAVLVAIQIALVPVKARGADPVELIHEVQSIERSGKFSAAADKAADGAADERLDPASRVLFGGLARDNYEQAFQKSKELDNLCRLSKVMRLVAVLDRDSSDAARKQMIAAAESAESRLNAAKGSAWREFCGLPPAPVVPSAPLPDDATPAASATPTASGVRSEGPESPPTPPAPRRSRAQLAVGASLVAAGVGFAAGFAGSFAVARSARSEIAALDADATAAGRDLTTDELAEAVAADARYVRMRHAGTALGVFAALGVVTGVVLLALPPRASARAHARPVGAGIRVNF